MNLSFELKVNNLFVVNQEAMTNENIKSSDFVSFSNLWSSMVLLQFVRFIANIVSILSHKYVKEEDKIGEKHFLDGEEKVSPFQCAGCACGWNARKSCYD